MRAFVRLEEAGEVTPVTAQSWESAIKCLCLSDRVPSAVREVFAEAQQMMRMGPWSYPLFTRGLEHALKCAELAVVLRARSAGVALSRRNCCPTTFAFKLNQLTGMKIMMREEQEEWTCLRELRNFIAHPQQAFS
jgi:hypothetical protein